MSDKQLAKILVVDGGNIMARDIQQSLESLGYAVPAIACSGAEAIQKAAEMDPDLVLVDTGLKGKMDSVTAVTQIRERFNIPVIYLTVHADDEISQQTNAPEPYGYLLAPFEERELHITIEMTLDRYRMEKKLKESEKRYKRLVGSVTDYIYRVEVENGQPVATIHGPGCVAVTGYRAQDYKADPYLWHRMVYEEDRTFVEEQATKIIAGEEVSPLEHRIIHKDGSIRWVRNTPVPQYDEQRRLIAYDGSIADITERKRAEEALRESEEKYRTLFEESRDAIYMATQDSKVIDANQTALDLFGYTREEMIGLDVRKMDVYPDERFKFQQEMEQKGFVRDYEIKLRKKDGTEMDCLLTATVRRTNSGNILGYQGIIHDITRRKALEEVWRRYEFIVNTSKDFMTLIDKHHAYVAVNEAYCRVHNKTRAEMIGETVANVWGEERYLTQIKPSLDKCLAGEEVYYQGWFEIPDLGQRCFDVAYYPYYGKDKTPTHAVVVSRDITKLKRVEEEVQRRNRELILLNQIIAASAASLEPETILQTACRELALAFDIPQAIATLLNEDRTVAVIVAEYLAEGQPTALRQTIPMAGSSSFQYLLNHQTPLVVNDIQNDPRLALNHVMRERDTVSLLLLPLVVEGRVVGSLGLDAIEPRIFSTAEINLAWSVADQVGGALARSRLDQEHRRLSTAIEQAIDNVIITDAEGRIVYVNPAFEQVSGYSRDDVIGQSPRILKSGRQEASFYEKLWLTISSGQVWQGRFVNKKKDGTLYILDATITPVRNEEGTIVNYVALQRDVTRVLQLEEQLRQAQKMEAIGRLAGGVAHDFNNILTVINGHSELLLQRYLDPKDPLRWEVEQIQEAGERAAVLTHQLLAFSRRQSVQPQVLNLNEVITGLQKMLRRIIGEDIELDIELDPMLEMVKADSGQMEQVFLNLVVNARDAMPQGGKLTIKTANVDLDEAYAEQHLEITPGLYVMLTVADTGIGLDVDTQPHIFEPFFTTKESEKGTGLGLSTVYGIIRQSNGCIWVYSELGKGTTFKVYLPRVAKEADETAVAHPAPAPSLQGTETILLVEDEANVRLVARKFLQRQGYTVLEAGHPKKALQICEQYKGQIDLLITDVIMPDLSGRELAERLTQLFSNLKVLYISGYANESLSQHGLLGSGIAFLEKPFSSEALARKVREALDAL